MTFFFIREKSKVFPFGHLITKKEEHLKQVILYLKQKNGMCQVLKARSLRGNFDEVLGNVFAIMKNKAEKKLINSGELKT